MQTREFAERVLFSTSLEEKLGAPGEVLRDDRPGHALATPDAPGRPDGLVMRSDGVRVKYPGEHQLDSDRDRGILLHFLANHELLATELMALVLLKFPDAPAEFRAGIVKTLADEQAHTKMYLRRMKACGVEFGEFAVNSFFWNAVAPMGTPLDYVTRLSLTFEQANLDFSRYYGELFRGAGDTGTAAVLEQIYRDEIGHVSYGLEWFRRWKDDGQPDFEAFEHQLPFPLSPARAKADHLLFNDEGRREAGLDEAFIERLRIYRRSKGRTPKVHLYNPWAEAAAEHLISGDPGEFRPDPLTAKMARDLDTLPAALARKDDIVLVDEAPSQAFLQSWHRLGITAPEFVVKGDPGMAERKFERVRPWAWEPGAIALATDLGERLSAKAEHPAAWTGELAQLYSKAFGASIRDQVGGLGARLVEEGKTWAEGRVVFEGDGPTPTPTDLVLKPLFGLAGRGAVRIAGDQPAPFAGLLEPWVERAWDFSAQYDFAEGRLRHLGFTQVEVGARGQFRACHVGPKWTKGAPPEVLRWIHSQKSGAWGEGGFAALYEEVIPKVLAPALHAAGFSGALGIDAFVYRQPGGDLALNPICEINPRTTMGRIALACLDHVAPGRAGTLRILPQRHPKLRAAGGFEDWANALPSPVLDPKGKLASGTWLLNDPAAAELALAVFEVGKEREGRP